MTFVKVLSDAERAIVALPACEGLSNAQIAHRLGRSPKTVASQLTHIYSKVADYRPAGESDGGDRHALIVLLRDCFASNTPCGSYPG